MKLATTTGDFRLYAAAQQDSLQYLLAAGFKYADYNFGLDYERQNGVYSVGWKDYLDDVRRTADRLGMKFVQAHSPMGKPLSQGAEHVSFVEATNRCIESCAALGIDRIVVHSGYAHGLSKEECFQRNRDFYRELIPTAEKHGVNILIENFNKMCVDGLYWVDNAADLRAMIDYIDHSLIHACWDAGHGNMQETPQDESLRILGAHVYALHVQDNMGDADSHMTPFFGTLNLDSLMHGLMDIGYSGFFTFEANSFLPAASRRPYDRDTRLAQAPLPLRIKAEELLYEIGRHTLSAYGCFEE